jgi:hypothetical protein
VKTGGNYPDIEALVLVIAHSQIVVAAPASDDQARAGRLRPLPAGFDEIDIAVLEWIAAEGRRSRRFVASL